MPTRSEGALAEERREGTPQKRRFPPVAAMAMVSQEQLQAVIAEMDGKIASAVSAVEQRMTVSTQGIVTQIDTTHRSMMDAIDGAVTSAIAEQTASTLDRVDKAVTAKLEELQKRVDSLLEDTRVAFVTERAEVKAQVDNLEAKLLAVGDGNLDRIGAKLVELDSQDTTRAALLGKMFQDGQKMMQEQLAVHETELYRINGDIGVRVTTLETKVAGAEQAFINLGPGASGGPPGGGRGARLRIPDPGAWKLDVFKAKEDGFQSWRDVFELQVGSVWLGLDALLTKVRETETVDSEQNFIRLRNEVSPVPEGNNEADWSYGFLRQKLYTIIYMHLGVEPRKAIELSEKCGFKAYRLLHK